MIPAEASTSPPVEDSLPLAPIRPISSRKPSTGVPRRQASRRRGGRPRRLTPSGSIATWRIASSAKATAATSTSTRASAASGQGRLDILRKDADPGDVGKRNERAQDHKKAGDSRDRTDRGSEQRLAGGDPGGAHPVEPEQAQGGQALVALLGAEAAGGCDEYPDRHQQGHDHQDHQQDDQRVLARRRRLASKAEDRRAAVRKQAGRAHVGEQIGRATEAGVGDPPCHMGVQPSCELASRGGAQEPSERG